MTRFFLNNSGSITVEPAGSTTITRTCNPVTSPPTKKYGKEKTSTAMEKHAGNKLARREQTRARDITPEKDTGPTTHHSDKQETQQDFKDTTGAGVN